MELMQASNQWRSRPDDERFTSLDEMLNMMRALRERSSGKVVSSRALKVQPKESDVINGIELLGPNGHAVEPTNWAFGQLATLAGAPAGYLKTLPAPVAADCLNYGLQIARDIEDVGVLLERSIDGSPNHLRAATGPRYGRIWNADVIKALSDRVGDGVTGNWKVPGEFGKDVEVTKANTTLYASDRDMFVFLADEKNRINVPARRNGKSGSLARGFFVWNSEVGAQTMGAAFFLFDYACCNRIVWGARDFTEMRLRHSAGAPDKWLHEIHPTLISYANSMSSPVENMIKAAQAKKLDDTKAFLANRFGARNALSYMQAHEREEGRPIETLWDVSTGITAYAKTIVHQDARVALEREAGKVLDLAA